MVTHDEVIEGYSISFDECPRDLPVPVMTRRGSNERNFPNDPRSAEVGCVRSGAGSAAKDVTLRVVISSGYQTEGPTPLRFISIVKSKRVLVCTGNLSPRE